MLITNTQKNKKNKCETLTLIENSYKKTNLFIVVVERKFANLQMGCDMLQSNSMHWITQFRGQIFTDAICQQFIRCYTVTPAPYKSTKLLAEIVRYN